MNDLSARGLLDITTFVIPRHIVYGSIEFLREVGKQGLEGFVLWAGKLEDGEERFLFTEAIAPEQEALRTKEGLLVVVKGDALFEVNKKLYERGEILAGQVHTHPTSAYHSGTDDHYPLVTLLGALSVVIPDFAVNAPQDIDLWAWYRLAGYGRWESLDQRTKVVFQ